MSDQPTTAAGRALLDAFTTKPDSPDFAIRISEESVVRHAIPRIEAEAYERGCVAGMAMERYAPDSPVAAYRADLAAKVRALPDGCAGSSLTGYTQDADPLPAVLALIEGEPQ